MKATEATIRGELDARIGANELLLKELSMIESNSRATLTVAYCTILDSLENKSERPEYESCTVVCRNIHKSIASFFNPDIKVKYLKSPPRKSKDDICCQWEFSLGS